MSSLLIVGLALLVLVVALSLWQRRGQVDHTARTAAHPLPAPPSTAPVDKAGPCRVKGRLQVDDPDLGVLTFDDALFWESPSLDFDGGSIIAELRGDANGPHPLALVLAVAAQRDARALGVRGRDVVVAELTRRGLATDDVQPSGLAVDVEDGQPVAYLWYEAGGCADPIGASSRDGWQTLTLEVAADDDV